ncbi:LOW QUALITY PROTEIN: hypothetical protein V2J09_004488 [Rumex salicifolius]
MKLDFPPKSKCHFHWHWHHNLQPTEERQKNLADLVLENKQWLEKHLKEVEVLLFRGYDVHTPADFNVVLEAFGYKEVPVIASGAPHTHTVGRVYTMNDGPPSKRFNFHNEMAYIEKHPTRAFVIVKRSLRALCWAMCFTKIWQPSTMTFHVESCVMVNNRVLANDHDPTSMIGRGWQATFDTDDRVEAEHKYYCFTPLIPLSPFILLISQFAQVLRSKKCTTEIKVKTTTWWVQKIQPMKGKNVTNLNQSKSSNRVSQITKYWV